MSDLWELPKRIMAHINQTRACKSLHGCYSRSLACVLVLVTLLSLGSFASVRAQSDPGAGDNPGGRSNLTYLPANAAKAKANGVQAPGQQAKAQGTPVQLIVDTDPGVDDAMALIWLLSQKGTPVNLLGVVTVAGNASIENTTNNALRILKELGRTDVPVVMGAAGPKAQALSKTSWFIHGMDGMWFLNGFPPNVLTPARTDSVPFYCETARNNFGATLLALGPLTNVANALEACPDDMRNLGRIVVLGGAKVGGNKTPLAEFNFWQDPEAASIVMSSGLPIMLIPMDAFVQTTITAQDVEKIAKQGNAAIQFLAPALARYVAVQASNTGRATVPDAVAAVYALNAAPASPIYGLVRVVLEPSLARGQSVMALTPTEQIAILATDAELSDLAAKAFSVPNFDYQTPLGIILQSDTRYVGVQLTAPGDLLSKTVLPSLRK